MSDDYSGFSTDLDGDGTEDHAQIYTLDDGSNVLVGDVDHDGQGDVAAYDSNGDGVYDQAYDAHTGEVSDLTGDGGDYAADYDGSGGNLDGDVVDGTGDPSAYDGSDSDASDTAGDSDPGDGGDGAYADPAIISDMMETQHETNMAIINNI